MKKCKMCAHVYADSEAFCPECGALESESIHQSQPVEKKAAVKTAPKAEAQPAQRTEPAAASEYHFQFKSHGEHYLIEKYVGTEAHVVVPAAYRGRKVLGILPEAFAHTAVTSVTIPANITRIPTGCFRAAKNLQQVTLHEGITEIDACAFVLCPNLSILDFGTKTPEAGIVYFPKNLRYIGKDAFNMHPVKAAFNSAEPPFKEITVSRRTYCAEELAPAKFYYTGEPDNAAPAEDAKYYAAGETEASFKLEAQAKAFGKKFDSICCVGFVLIIAAFLGLFFLFQDLGLASIGGPLLIFSSILLLLSIMYGKRLSNKHDKLREQAQQERFDYFNNRCY